MDSLKAWWRQPYASDMSMAGWFAFIGALLIISASWRLILGHVIGGVEK